MTTKNPLKTGAYVRCPRRHKLAHAWLGSATMAGTIGESAFRLECAHLSGVRGQLVSSPYYVEFDPALRDVHPLTVSCMCDFGTLWHIDPRIICELLPATGIVDVDVARVAMR